MEQTDELPTGHPQLQFSREEAKNGEIEGFCHVLGRLEEEEER